MCLNKADLLLKNKARAFILRAQYPRLDDNVINEKSAFSDNFDECYAAMKENGIQFGISELKYYKLYLTAEEYLRYTQRYLDRPKIHDQGHDDKGNWYIFNCSKFQLEGYFNPFGNGINIKD